MRLNLNLLVLVQVHLGVCKFLSCASAVSPSHFRICTQTPKPSDRVVYLAGAWDMFHAGHIEILERARA
jgi:bifunctional ADP-heptose synthase (sugar kinase/adenylyltransferase)